MITNTTNNPLPCLLVCNIISDHFRYRRGSRLMSLIPGGGVGDVTTNYHSDTPTQNEAYIPNASSEEDKNEVIILL